MKNKNYILTTAKAILLVILAYVSFKLAFPITNSIIEIERGPALMIGILVTGPIWVLVYMITGIAVTSISWSILVYFLDRYLLAKEVKQEELSFFSYIPIAVAGTSVIITLVISIIILYAIYLAPKSTGKSQLHSSHTRIMSFSTRHSVKIYKDKRVLKYS